MRVFAALQQQPIAAGLRMAKKSGPQAAVA
jgi:hypothetical protein